MPPEDHRHGHHPSQDQGAGPPFVRGHAAAPQNGVCRSIAAVVANTNYACSTKFGQPSVLHFFETMVDLGMIK